MVKSKHTKPVEQANKDKLQVKKERIRLFRHSSIKAGSCSTGATERTTR